VIRTGRGVVVVLTGPAMLTFALFLAGCPAAVKEPSTMCVKAGQTCKLGPGLLGVCTEAAPDTCDREPCYTCMSQH
jgi:hypothetical protein